MGNAVAFFEITSDNHQRAQEFYAKLFDWKVQADPAMGGYAVVDTGAGESAVAGGIGPSMAPGDAGVKIYLRVDDLDAYVKKAQDLGAKVLVEPQALPGDWGTIAVVSDPDGNPVGLWK
ncbi:VOC family protein [Fodinicola acaciae]|uniref:VOC family protein n=1 Tax=Fodinicola acaciae TaxID=2681555 RepID=UPI0013D2DEA2|nr:VOC family protein [Fodinicola acaciae]